MRLRRELSYDAATEDVRAMLRDPAFWDRVAAATGALTSTTTVAGSGDAVTVTTEEDQAVAGVPSFAKKLVGESTRAIKAFRWAGDEAELSIETPGKPTALRGTASLTGDDSAAVVTYDLDVTASVPLIGGKLEKLVCDLTSAGLDTEHGVGRAWLRGER